MIDVMILITKEVFKMTNKMRQKQRQWTIVKEINQAE